MVWLRGRAPYLMLLGAVVGLDQLTKAIVDRLIGLHESRPIVEGLVSLTYVRNRGAAFGLLSEANIPYQSILFSIVSLLALGAIVSYAMKLPPESRLPQAALTLVMGGAVGNLIDRARLGYVIDFIDVFWGSHHWPAFNAADSAISVGVTLLILDILRAPGTDEQPKRSVVGAATPAGRSQ